MNAGIRSMAAASWKLRNKVVAILGSLLAASACLFCRWKRYDKIEVSPTVGPAL